MSEFRFSNREGLILDELTELWIEALAVQDNPELFQRKKQAIYSKAEDSIDGGTERVEKFVREAHLLARQMPLARTEMDRTL